MADAPPPVYSELFPDKSVEASAPLNPGAPSAPYPTEPGASAPYQPSGAGEPGSAPPPGAGYQSLPGYGPSQPPYQTAGQPPPPGQPYPPQGQPYPQQGQPYPQQGQPYPQQGQPYPQQGQPYPQQGQPYPQPGQPYSNPAQQAGQFHPVPNQQFATGGDNYTHSAVTVTGPPNAGLQTTPLAYGTTSQIGRYGNDRRKRCLIICVICVTLQIIVGVILATVLY